MTENKLYDNLLSLPLFLGMSKGDLQRAAGQTKFDFRKAQEEEVIVEEGDRCQRLYFLLDGDINVITEADDHGYRIEEDITAPEIFQPEHIFGLSQRFTHTYVAKSHCSLLCLEKKDVTHLSDNFEIFRINLLNLISTQSQKYNRRALRVPPKSLEERIIRFFESHCIRPAGEKKFHVKMVRMAEELNDSRLDVSRALNRMQAQNLIQLKRELIYIPALEKLLTR